MSTLAMQIDTYASSSPSTTTDSEPSNSQCTPFPQLPIFSLTHDSSLDTIVSSSSSPSSSQTGESSTQHSKPHKITASNGGKVLLSLKVPPKKRVKRNASWNSDVDPVAVKRGSRAKLAKLLSMPLDVLYETFSHLEPLDLLYLSRTTTQFRRFLLHKSATGVWKSALANAPPGLPQCPAEMSLPSWLSLAFEPRCSNCSAGVKQVEWMMRARFCAKCKKTCLVSERTLDAESKKDKLLIRCVPFGLWNGGPIKYCTLAAKNAFMKQLQELEGDRNAFVEKKREEMKARAEHAKRCKVWYDKLQKMRADEIHEIKLTRRKTIENNLRDMGFSKQIDYIQHLYQTWDSPYSPSICKWFHEHLDINKSKPLTDRTWNNMKSNMIRYMGKIDNLKASEDRRRLIIDREFTAQGAWTDWLREHPTKDLMPTPVDVLKWAEFKSIVEQPGENKLKPVAFTHALAALPGWIERWRDETYMDVLCALGRSFGLPTGNTPAERAKQIQLAAVVFLCKEPDTHWLRIDDLLQLHSAPWEKEYVSMWYPEYLHHHCNRVVSLSTFARDLEPAECRSRNNYTWLNKEFKGCQRKQFDTNALMLDEKGSRTVKAILEACNLDWRTTTVAQLDEIDPRVVCLKCSFGAKCDGERRFTVFTWRVAVQHCTKVHWGDSRVTWERVCDEDAAQARKLEVNEHARRGLPALKPEKIWSCSYCRDSTKDLGRMSFTQLKDHMDDENHPIKSLELRENKDYYRALEAPSRLPLSVKLVLKKVESLKI